MTSFDCPFFLANCRSIIKKTESLGDYFENSEFSFGILTETWLNENNEPKIKEDLRELHNLDLITRNRKGRGGGVAIVSKINSELSFKHHAFFSGEYETVCARAVTPAAGKSIYVFACYYPPNMKQSDVDKFNELVSDEVLRIQSREKQSPFIIIAGDMNLKNVDCFCDIDGVKLILTNPTRNDACLDLCYTNCNIIKNDVHIPLWSFENVDSDHKVVSYIARFQKQKRNYKKLSARKVTKVGEEKFRNLMKETDWSEMDSMEDVEDRTTWFHNKIETYKDECFPWKVRKIRDDEDPWVTDHIRKKIKERNKIFRLNGRKKRWKDMKHEVRTKMARSRKAYYDREVEKIKNSSDKRGLAYTALKNLKCSSRPKQWSLCDMNTEKDELDIAEEVADYFNSVNSSYSGVKKEQVPSTYDRPVYPLTKEMIAKRIRTSKKPNSSVPGDVPPNLVNDLAEVIAIPAEKIFNCVPTQHWPIPWKHEYQTIIPKKPNPKSFSELRNLSCTNFLSKVLESFVIDSIQNEIELSELQYGGLKGCGTDNFLVEVWNNVLESLDEKEKAMSIMSIDFSKAFNRLEHQACLKKLAEKNASNQTLSMVFSFLSGRRMSVKAGGSYTRHREVMGGSPQGTKLGNLLFCFAIDDITIPAQNPSPLNSPQQLDNNDDVIESPISAIPDQYLPNFTSTPGLDDSFNPNPHGLRRKRNVINDTTEFCLLDRDEYREVDTWEIGYVDDINVGEVLNTNHAISTFSVNKELKEIRSKGCEKMFEVIKHNGAEVGMQINPAKTQLLCISANNNAEIRSHICVDGKKLESEKTLKILGFTFGERPSAHYHVDNLISKFNRSIWSIFHLKRAQLATHVLVTVYISMIRPILEYASNVIFSMLTKEDESRLEACQKRAMRLLYGFEVPYTDCLVMAKIKTLTERRKELFEKFSIKMSQSSRFEKKWLPKKHIDPDAMNLRKRKKYIEFASKTDRLYKSPVYTMRRLLNDLK